MKRILTFDVAAPRVHHRGRREDSPQWITSNQRGPRMSTASGTKRWVEATADVLAELPAMPEPFTGRVLVVCRVYKAVANRYDPMNWYGTGKAIVDATVRAGVLADDDWKHVLGPLMDHGGTCAKGREHIVVTIEEVEGRGLC